MTRKSRTATQQKHFEAGFEVALTLAFDKLKDAENDAFYGNELHALRVLRELMLEVQGMDIPGPEEYVND